MIVVSGYFGERLTGVYAAIPGVPCYFFSNNENLRAISERQGWTFVFENIPLSGEPRISSLQSKCVKFLQFDKDKIDWTRGQSIIYFDHKFEVKLNHLQEIETLCTRQILVRDTPKLKKTLQDEVDVAIRQKRYAEVMKETVEWINRKVMTEGYSASTRIVNTGLIFYKHPQEAQELCDDVFKTCWSIGQPECQVIWAVLSQKYTDKISRIRWNDLRIGWKEPPLI